MLLMLLSAINKKQDTGFPMTERDRLGLRGLLPPRVISFEQQYDRFSKLAILCLALVACMKVNIRLFIVTKGDYAQFI